MSFVFLPVAVVSPMTIAVGVSIALAFLGTEFLLQLVQTSQRLLFLRWDNQRGARESDERGSGERRPRRGLHPSARVDRLRQVRGDLPANALHRGGGVVR